MSKRELVDRIVQLNRGVRREFLLGFTENELADYLGRLEIVSRATEPEPEPLPLAC